MDGRHGRMGLGGFEQLKGRPDLTSTAGRPAASSYSTVQQQDYLASVWLSKKEKKLEHSQQKCIVIFALVCCFAVLVALIFSAVDVLGEDEDGINEENCSRDCKAVLVQNIPDRIFISHEDTMPLTTGLESLLNRARKSVEIVSPLWALNSTDHWSHYTYGRQVTMHFFWNKCFLSLINLCLAISGAEVHDVNMTALTTGELHSSFWVVDRKHMYIGSADMDWRSLSTRKELGVIIYDCSCLVLDLHRIFSLYKQLQYRDFVPAIWSKRLAALYNKEKALSFQLNGTNTTAFFSSSPDKFSPKDRNRDLQAIIHVIQEAREFIYISITDYLPLIIQNSHNKYWSRIDEMLREALILKHIEIRMLISCRQQTHPLTSNFMWSLKSLCMEMSNCSMEVKFFIPWLLQDGSLIGTNHHRYMVTDKSVYIGNFDWVANEFLVNAGTGLVISKAKDERSFSLGEQLKGVFERDWQSTHSKTLQPSKIPTCSTNTVFPSPLLKSQKSQTEHENGPNASL
uniref:Phospholipase D family member 5 n=1 Tax=Astyanax mexicanus TaxID=7994 RepID=A0A8B9KZ75_ASTMX